VQRVSNRSLAECSEPNDATKGETQANDSSSTNKLNGEKRKSAFVARDAHREQRVKHESMMRWRMRSARIVTLPCVVVGAARGNYSSALLAHIVPNKRPPLTLQHSRNFNGNSGATIKGRREMIPQLSSWRDAEPTLCPSHVPEISTIARARGETEGK